MGRFFFFIIWCLAGFCVYLGGCSVSLSAEKLDATWQIKQPPAQSPTTVEVHYDKDNDESGIDKAGAEDTR